MRRLWAGILILSMLAFPVQGKQNKKSNPCTPKMQMAPLDKRVSKHKTQGSNLKLLKIPWQGLMSS